MKTNGNKNVNKNVKISRTSLLALLFTAILILSAGIGTVSADGPVWTAKPAWNAPVVNLYAEPAFADMDNDGDMDILGTAISDDMLAWWGNDGEEDFDFYIIDDQFSFAYEAIAFDVDQDGDLDIIAASYTGNSIAWWENRLDPPFPDISIDPEILEFGDVDVGGLIGENIDGAVSDCYSVANVTGDSDVGGLMGRIIIVIVP